MTVAGSRLVMLWASFQTANNKQQVSNARDKSCKRLMQTDILIAMLTSCMIDMVTLQ